MVIILVVFRFIAMVYSAKRIWPLKKFKYPLGISNGLNRFDDINMKSYMPVETKDIALFYKDTLTYIYLFNGDKMIYDYSTLDETELLLDPNLFFRANRQCIININSIQTVKPQMNLKLDILLKAPLKIPVDVSREKATQFKKWLDR
jgi:DNA-binding LytR/AlgR family response regulator